MLNRPKRDGEDGKSKRLSLSRVTQADIEKFQQERRGIESEFLSEMASDRKRAWSVAKVSWCFTGLAMFGLFFTIHRYSQPIVPPVIVMNPETNAVQQVSIMADKMHYSEAMDKYWLGMYVVHHESYDFNSLQIDYDAVGLMSAPSVADDYRRRYTQDKLDKKLGDSEDTQVFIHSVVVDQKHLVASVRFSTVRHVHTRDKADAPKYYIAEIGYKYANVAMTAAQREINPLGFRVTSFRMIEESPEHVGN